MNDRFAESQTLHRRARAFADAFGAGRPMPEPFDQLAVELARFQARYVDGYGRLCAAHAVDPARFERASDAPAIPTDTFRYASIFAFAEADAAAVFRTSGTTLGARGEHRLRDTGSYDAGALAFARATLFFGFPERLPLLVLGPSPSEATDSSLTHMLALFASELGLPAPIDETYFVRDGDLDLVGLDARIARELVAHRPLLLAGTSFAFVHLLDALGDELFRLPHGSRAMLTGGFKGKSREVPADVLRCELARAFCIDEAAIVAEYGMTELSSQAYELRCTEPSASPGVYVEPPWMRVVPVDPETFAPVTAGEIGLARVEDLMNVDSAFAVVAGDRVRRVPGGFELLGRATGATPRGCSIAVDEILGASGQ